VSGLLDGKAVLISGIGRGIGRVAALEFAAAGAAVFGGDLDTDSAEATVAMAAERGLSIASAAVDVTTEESVVSWVEQGARELGRIDVLYNNAGAVRFGSLAAQPFEDWRFTMAAELDSVFLVTKAAWSHLASTHGCVVNVGSVVGLAGSLTVGRVAHTASKGAVISLTRQLAAEGAPLGIRVNTISPGLIETEGSRESLLHPNSPMARGATAVPLKRLGSPADVVEAAMFLASEKAGYITGANLVIDGGWSAVLPFPSAR
jgi:NAD(P)-dependent dehydrogenase (short-subunit alcohol dehydrogenase family)